PVFYTLSLHDALPILFHGAGFRVDAEEPDLMLSKPNHRWPVAVKRVTSAKNFDKRMRKARNQLWKSGRAGLIAVSADQYLVQERSEEHTSELQSRGHL